MKKTVISIVIGAVILFISSACTKTQYDLFGNITGIVVDKESGEPLGQVAVTLSSGGLNTYTGSDGHFEFKEIDAGSNKVWVQKTGYQSNNKSIEVLSGETIDISITMKKQ